jgi:hypothetical protein
MGLLALHTHAFDDGSLPQIRVEELPWRQHLAPWNAGCRIRRPFQQLRVLQAELGEFLVGADSTGEWCVCNANLTARSAIVKAFLG